MTRLVCAITFLLLMITPITAQDDAPYPVLDAADIFADGVTVIERLPIANFDNRERELHYYHPDLDEWRTYPYPLVDEDLRLFGREETTGTNMLVASELNSTWLPYMGDKSIWTFSPETERFEPIKPICNLMPAESGQGIWRITKIEDEYFLCNNETGQMSSDLNRLLVRGLNDMTACFLDLSVQISSDARWLIFHDCYEEEHFYSAQAYRVYAYNIETDTMKYLGLTEYATRASIYQWVDNGSAIYASSREAVDNSFTGNTNEFIYSNKVFYEITFVEDRPQMSRLFDISAEGIPPTENGFTWIEVNSQPHGIYEYNFFTQQQTLLATLDTCESYTCYVRWNNESTLGVLAEAVESPPVGAFYIYDRKNDEWVLETFAMVVRVQDDAILFYEYDEAYNTYLKSIDLTTFEETVLRESELGSRMPYPYPSPDRRYIVLSDQVDDIQLDIYDIETDIVHPLLSIETSPYYYFDIKWQDDNSLIVEARDDYYSGDAFARWRVRVDAMDEENS